MVMNVLVLGGIAWLPHPPIHLSICKHLSGTSNNLAVLPFDPIYYDSYPDTNRFNSLTALVVWSGRRPTEVNVMVTSSVWGDDINDGGSLVASEGDRRSDIMSKARDSGDVHALRVALVLFNSIPLTLLHSEYVSNWPLQVGVSVG